MRRLLAGGLRPHQTLRGVAAKLKQYRIRCVPTLVIDGRIKLEGKPEFALICDEEMYRFLEERYSMA